MKVVKAKCNLSLPFFILEHTNSGNVDTEKTLSQLNEWIKEIMSDMFTNTHNEITASNAEEGKFIENITCEGETKIDAFYNLVTYLWARSGESVDKVTTQEDKFRVANQGLCSLTWGDLEFDSEDKIPDLIDLRN